MFFWGVESFWCYQVLIGSVMLPLLMVGGGGVLCMVHGNKRVHSSVVQLTFPPAELWQCWNPIPVFDDSEARVCNTVSFNLPPGFCSDGLFSCHPAVCKAALSSPAILKSRFKHSGSVLLRAPLRGLGGFIGKWGLLLCRDMIVPEFMH